jgi:DnaJ domain
MTEPNPYVLMGVGQSASKEEIHDAYRKLAKRYHPDLHPGDAAAERSFKEIAAAYALLSDPLERARFDREFSESAVVRDHASAKTGSDHAYAGRGWDTPPRSQPGDSRTEFRYDPTIDHTGFDPDKGYQIAEPDDRWRLIARIFLVAILISIVVEAADLGRAWRPTPGATRAGPRFYIDPVTITVCVALFVAACGTFIAWIMNGVERRAREDDAKRR